jgi:thiamine transporter
MEELILSLGKDGLKSAYSLLESFALYLTFAVAIILLIAFVIIKVRNQENLKSFKTLALGIVIGYAVTITACISYLMIARMQLKEELDSNFYLMLGFFVLVLAYAITATITASFSKKAFKITNIVGICASICYGILLLILIPTAGSDYAPLSDAGMYIFSALLVAVIVLACIFFGKDKGGARETKAVSFAGVTIALSFALSYVKIFSLPQGGSVTLASMLPLIIYAYVFGARKGVLAGAIYGILQCLQNPQFYQPMQFLLDYPVAFGGIGIVGIARNFGKLKDKPVASFIVGAVIAVVLRYIAHTISGYYVFSSWAWEGWAPLAYAMVYNLYCFVDLAVLLVPAVFVFSSKAFRRQFLDK